MSSYSSDASRSGHRSPLFGTSSYSTLTPSESAQTRYSYSSRSGISSDDSDISRNNMRRITVSPSPPERRSGSDLHSWSEGDSIRDDAEVEAVLSALDDELDQTEDALTEWSRGSSATPSSYLSGSASSPSFTSTSSVYIPFTNTLRDARILSTITERTENPSSRPTSHNLSVPGSRPVSDAIRRSAVSLHSRGATEPGPSTGTPIRRTGDLIAFFEDKSSSSDNSSRPYSPYGHQRTSSVPAGPRSPSPYTQTSQSIPTFATTTYGYGGSHSRPSSPSKSWLSQSQSYTSGTPSHSFLSLPPRSNTTGTDSRLESPYTSSETPTYSNTFTSTSYGLTDTSATTPQGTSLRRPQTSPRSPLSSVRNIITAWKSRSPSIDKSSQVSPTDTTPEEGFFSIRRRASRGFQRERASMGGEPGPGTFRRSGVSHDQEVPSTPRTNTSLTPSGIMPPPFDLTELGTFAKGSQEPLRIGLLWYLNVHAPPPYRWQRCQAVLYPNMLLLSWIAQGGGRGIVTLDLLNCTEVRSVASPTHPSAQDDVGTIAAKRQTANAQAEGFGELGLMETLCPFQLFYSDGVERLGAESARERVRWVSAIWEVLDRSVTVPDRSETQSPTGSMRTIQSMASASTHSSSVSGSRSTTFLPPMDTIPDISDFQSLSGSSTGSLSRQPSLRSRAVDDGAISNQTIVYPGDPRVIAPSRSSSLRRTTSMTDLGEEFESALRRAKDARPGLGFGLGLAGTIIGEGSPVTVSSGPTLRRDIIVTPPPSAGRPGGSRTRPVRSESAASVSDDAFFSSGTRTSGGQSTFHSLSSTLVTTPVIDATSAILTEESSGSGTVVPHTNRGEGTPRLGTLAEASRTAGLSRSRAVRTRRDGASSVSYSSSSLSGVESSDKENSSNRNPSRSYSEDDELSTLESYSRSAHTRSANGTPLPSSSSERTPRSEGEPSTTDTPTSSTPYETARSPSIMSFASLPSIPSLYGTAEVCSTESEATKSVSGKASPKVDSVSDYITAPVCESEPPSPFATAEVCPTEVSTEYDDAECRCKPEKVVVSEGVQVAEPVEQVVAQPVEEPVRTPEEAVPVVPLPLAGEDIPVPIPIPIPVPSRAPSPVPVPAPGPIPIPVLVPAPPVSARELAPAPAPVVPTREPVVAAEPVRELPITYMDRVFPLYPVGSPTTSAPSDIESSTPSVSMMTIARDTQLPEPVISARSETPVSSARSVGPVVPPLPAPSPIGPPETLPTTSLLTSVTESTPSVLTPSRTASSRVPTSPSIRESLWAPETDDTYESSILRASPSVQSIAFPEGPDISFDTSFLRPTASAYSSQEQTRLSTIDESSSESPAITSSSSSRSLTPTAIVSGSSISASSPSLPPTAPSPSLQAPSSTTVVTPLLSPGRLPVSLTRTPSTISTVSSISSMRSDALDNGSLFEEPILEDVSTVPSLLSSHVSSAPRAISPAQIPLPRSPSMLSMPTAIVSMTSPRGSTPSIRSELLTIPSERSSTEAPSERPSVIITDDINRLLQYLHGLENDRQRDNQGVHDHLGDIQNELRDLADYIHEKEPPAAVPPPAQLKLKDQSVGGESVVSWRSPRGAPDYPEILPTVVGKTSPKLTPIQLSPPPLSPRSPSSLSSSISFLESYHSDDFSLMESESEPFIRQSPSSLSSTPISSSPRSSSIPSSPSSSPSSRTLPLTPISQSPPSSGEYLSQTSTDTRRVVRPPVSPTPSVVSSATVRPGAPGIDHEALNRIRNVLDAVKAQTDALQDGQLSTNNILDELRQRHPLLPDNAELVERLQRLEDLINRLADAQRHARAPTEQESLFDSGSDTSAAIRHLRERWERMTQEIPVIAPTPQRPQTSLDDMMAELLQPPQPPAPLQIQPPPAFVPLNFRPDARGPRPRSASPTPLTELPPRPYTVPIPVESFATRDLGRRRPSRIGRPPRPSAQAPREFVSLQPPETPVIRHDFGRRPRGEETGPDFLDNVHQIRGRRPTGSRDGWVRSRQEPESAPAPPPPVSAPPIIQTVPFQPPQPQPPFVPGQGPQFAQPGVVPPMPPPFTQSVILPPIFNDMMSMVRENRFMHLASLEQQRELMRYMNSLNDWLGHDVEDRQAEFRGVSARIDRLAEDLNRLGLSRGPFPPPGPGGGFGGGFAVPGGPGVASAPSGPGGLGMPVRPGTVQPGGATFVPPPPQGYPYGQQYPPGGMMPPYDVPYGRTPTATESPVVPSPPLRRGDQPYIPPDLGPSHRGSIAMPHIYQPIPPGGEEEPYIPPEPSYTTSRTPSIGSPPRSPSLAPAFIPPPQFVPSQAAPPIFVHPASQRSPSQLDRTASPGRSRTPPTPPPAGGQTIINMPPHPGLVAPGVPPSTHYDDRAGDFPPHPVGQPQFHIPVSPRRSERPEFDDRRGTPQQPGGPIIIQPPHQTMVPPPVPFGPPGVPLDLRPRSHSPTYSSRSSRPSYEGGAPMVQPMFGIPPQGPLPGFGVQPGPPINIGIPSHGPSEYRDPTQMGSPRPYPSRPPTRFDEGPIQPFHPPMPIPVGVGVPPTAIHIDPGRRPSRYDSRTPPSDRGFRERGPSRGRGRSRTPSYESEREPRRGSRYRSPSPSYHGPVGVGPGFDPGFGHPVVQPPVVTHVHAPPQPSYPPPSQLSYVPPSPTGESVPRTDRGGEPPLPHPFGAPAPYHPPEQFPVPTGRAPSGHRAPTVVEVVGHPERIRVHSPDFGQPRTESGHYEPPISGPVTEGIPRSTAYESQLRGASPSAPIIPFLPSEGQPRTGRYPPSGIPQPETYGHIRPESLTTRSEEYEPPIDDEYRYRGAPGERPRGAPGEGPRGAPGEEPRGAPGEEPRGAPGEEPRGAPGPGVSRAPTTRGAPGLSRAPTGRDAPVPGTYGHISPRSLTPPTEEAFGEEPRGAPGPGVSPTTTGRGAPGVSRAPTGRGAPVPETFGHIVPRSLTTPTEEGFGEEPRGAPGPGVSRAPTTARGGPDVVPRLPSGPGALEYDDAERARQERFGEIARQLADVTQDAEESEMRREHDFQEKEAERDQRFAEKQAEWDRQFQEREGRRDEILPTLARQPGPPGSGPFPEDMLEVPERAESVIASIRRASTESAARHADDIRGIVQGEREEMARQLQAEREETRAAKEALEQQVLAERQRADDERDARMRELEEELARVRAELDQERQQRDHDEEMRREADSQRNLERDEESRQQLSEITDLLLAHREEFARKKEAVDERWNEKLRWRDETNNQFQGLFNMVQGVIDSCAEQRERCEQERLAAEQRPSTQDVMNALQGLREEFERLTASWREDTERQHGELLETVRSTANVQVPFNVQGYLDEFSKSLASEVRMLLNEVSKLREERRNIQFEIGTLLCLRSKYEAGGMFDPDWKPPSTGPLAPQPPGDLPPDEPSAPPPEPRQGAWRAVHQRGGFRRTRKKSEPRPAGPVVGTTPPSAPPPDRAQTAGSWATWQVQPDAEYTPPPSEPTIHLAPEVPPPRAGLFGPRSPRGSS